MKRINVLVLMLFIFFMSNVFGQQQMDNDEPYGIKTDSLTIAFSKTTNIVFPYTIINVDKGSNDLLVQKVKGVENILQLKAAKLDFNETNLTVVTSDGQLYSFILNYDEKNPVLNMVLSNKKKTSEYLGSTKVENEQELKSYAELAFYDKKKLHHVKDSRYEMKFQLNGIFIHESVMYYRLKIENHSNVGYDISQLRFFIRDQKKVKRTASQEIEISPLYIYNDIVTVEGKSEVYVVFALAKFTMPDKKYLAIQLMEEHGGRHLELQVKNSRLRKLAVLPTL